MCSYRPSLQPLLVASYTIELSCATFLIQQQRRIFQLTYILI